MVAVEQDKEDADGGREEQESVLGERIGLEEPAAKLRHADLVLRLLVVTVQGRKIDVGRCVVDVDVLMRRPEYAARAQVGTCARWADSGSTHVWMTSAAKENIMLDRPAGWGTNCGRPSSVSLRG